jgi:hypothetical protein
VTQADPGLPIHNVTHRRHIVLHGPTAEAFLKVGRSRANAPRARLLARMPTDAEGRSEAATIGVQLVPLGAGRGVTGIERASDVC